MVSGYRDPDFRQILPRQTGSFTDIPRESYIPAERRVIKELQELGKPFLVIVNSSEPTGERAEKACSSSRSRCHVADEDTEVVM